MLGRFQIGFRANHTYYPRNGQQEQARTTDKSPQGVPLQFQQWIFCGKHLCTDVQHQCHQQEFHQHHCNFGVLHPLHIGFRGSVPIFPADQEIDQTQVDSHSHQSHAAQQWHQHRQIFRGDPCHEKRAVVVHGVERLDMPHGEKADAVAHDRHRHENRKAFPAGEPEHAAIKHHKQRYHGINRHVKARKNSNGNDRKPLPIRVFLICQQIEEQYQQHRQKTFRQSGLFHPDHDWRSREYCTGKCTAAFPNFQILAKKKQQKNSTAIA